MSLIASGFSIFATIFALLWCLLIMCLSSIISRADRTKDKPTQSTLWSIANCKSSWSFSVNEGKEITVLGKFTPLFEDKIPPWFTTADRKSTRLNSSHVRISYAVFCLKKKNNLLFYRHGETLSLPYI